MSIIIPEGFYVTTLSADINASTTTIPLTTVPARISSGYIVIEPNHATKREVIYFTSVGVSSITSADDTTDASDASGRGCLGSITQGANTSHLQGVTVVIASVEQYWKRLQTYIDDNISGAWNVQFRPQENVAPSSAYATLDTRNGHLVLDFDHTTDEEAVFTGILPSAYNSGGLTVEIYASATSATSGNVVWQAAIERIGNEVLDIDSDSFAAFQSSGAVAVSSTTGFVKKYTVAFTDGSQMDSLAAGELFRLKIRRDADNTSATDSVTTSDMEVHLVRIIET